MEDIIVAKFGGSSLAHSNQFVKVKDIVKSDERRRYIVPSAPGKRSDKDHKITDLLYKCYQLASSGLNFDKVFSIIQNRFEDTCNELDVYISINQILGEIKNNISNGATRDYVASRGEYLNAIVLSNYLGFEFIDASDLIFFDNNGQFDAKSTEDRIRSRLEQVPYAVIPGFYGAKENGDIITFSRGGSDMTGAIIANGINAILYENWTDVSGFLMADPRIVKNAKAIATVTYKELRELSYMGASVLHEEAIFPVRTKKIPINIRNTNSPQDKGTMIVDDLSPVAYRGITGIAGKKDFTVITLEKTLMNNEKGFLSKLVSIFGTNDISIEHIPSSIDSVSVIVATSELDSKLDKVMEEIRLNCKPDNIISYSNMALIAVVGRGMISTKGISSKIFTALAKDGVNVRMMTQGSSELNIIVGIENEDFKIAIKAIYNAFNKIEEELLLWKNMI